MHNDALLFRLKFVCYGDNYRRLTIKFHSHDDPEITFDAHGLTVQDAKRVIRNIINISQMPIHPNVIHGFNHGTGIKDMLENDMISGKISSKCCPDGNPGMTLINVIAA